MAEDTETEIHTGGDRVEVDLRDRVDEMEEARELIQAVLEGDEESLDDPELVEDGLDPMEEADLRERDLALEHEIELLETDIERFGGSTFTIKKFRAGEAAQVNDLTLEDTLGSGSDDPRTKLGARRLRMVQVGVVETPPDCPDDPKEFEAPTNEFLADCIENLNTYGRVSLPDF